MKIISKLNCGFSILETAVVLVVTGILMTVSLNGVISVSSWLRRQNDLKKMQIIKIALENFFTTYQRLPAPAKYTDITTNATGFGTENNVNIYNNYNDKNGSLHPSKAIYNSHYLLDITRYGIVPFKELGLQKEDVIDAYGNFIEYYVVGIMIDGVGEQTQHGESGYFTKLRYELVASRVYGSNNAATDSYICGAVSGGARPCNEKIAAGSQLYSAAYEESGVTDPIYIRPYGLRVKDVQTDKFVDRNGTIAFVLVSHGKNGNQTCCLKNNKSNNTITNYAKITASTASGEKKYEAQNCLNISSGNGVLGREMMKNTSSSSHSPFVFYQGAQASFFDDIVEYGTLAELLLKE